MNASHAVAKGNVREFEERISSAMFDDRDRTLWWIGFILSSVLVLILAISLTMLFWRGIGIWGVNVPVSWGFAIANFVWWIGIGHAGTFISAILLLLNQQWRTSINRFAEAMTLFAVMCAGIFPLIHLGRPQRIYWLLPYPNTMEIWPQFRSALIWDEFAVFTYFTVSLLFWYQGLIPDLASLRDSAPGRARRMFYGVLALGWRGEARDWREYERTYYILAGIATPLVVSVHSVVSLDFASAQVPGWHNPLFPPYFVAGAIFSGFAMVLTLMIPLRRVYRFENVITARHLDCMAKIMLVTAMIVAYGYAMEWFMGWYGGEPFEQQINRDRLVGRYAPWTYAMLFCNVAVPQLLWIPKIRVSTVWLFVISIFINIGMWIERFVIVIGSLHIGFLPSGWGMYYPTIWDISTLFGSIGLFLFLIFLFTRIFPVISMHEVRRMYGEGH